MGPLWGRLMAATLGPFWGPVSIPPPGLRGAGAIPGAEEGRGAVSGMAARRLRGQRQAEPRLLRLPARVVRRLPLSPKIHAFHPKIPPQRPQIPPSAPTPPMAPESGPPVPNPKSRWLPQRIAAIEPLWGPGSWGAQIWSFGVKNGFSELEVQLWGPKIGLSAPKLGFLSSKLGLRDSNLGFGGPNLVFWGAKLGVLGSKLGLGDSNLSFGVPKSDFGVPNLVFWGQKWVF